MKIVITVEVPDGADVSVGAGNATESPAAKPAKAKKAAPAAAPESAQPAATQPQAASAPAAQPAQSPAVQTFPPLTLVNKKTQELAQVNRDAAVEILTKYGATTLREGKTIVNTSLLKPEQYQLVIDAMEEKKASIDAAATQVSLV